MGIVNSFMKPKARNLETLHPYDDSQAFYDSFK